MAGDELKVPSQRNDGTRDGRDHDLTGRYVAGKVPADTDPLDTPPTDRDPAGRARSGLGRNDPDSNDMGRNATERSDAERLDAERSDTLAAEVRKTDARKNDARNDVRRAEAERADRPGDDRAVTNGDAITADPAHTSPAPGHSPVREPGHDDAALPGGGADREPAFRDGPYAEGDGPEQARPGEAAAAHAAPGEVVLFERDPAEVQARWRDLQASFVDDPGEAVQRADGLVGEVVESLTSTLNSRTAALRDRWKSAGDSGTEEMRQALREYRDVLERLLALSGSSPSQSQIRK
ncbi:hypothetical protein [Nonomuraea maritima]|uniref:hypothetical protein n=1 Tax=Nonomuraea maritima TaxID=683260 RepID=UPI003723BFF0